MEKKEGSSTGFERGLVPLNVEQATADIMSEIRDTIKSDYHRYVELKKEEQSLRKLKSDYEQKLEELTRDDQSIFNKISSAMVESLLSKKREIKIDMESIQALLVQIEQKALPAIVMELGELETVMIKTSSAVIMKRKPLFQKRFDGLISEAKDVYAGWDSVVVGTLSGLDFRAKMGGQIISNKKLSVREASNYFQKIDGLL